MNDKEFGCKIRHLREQYGFTREGFCGDESELSVRQLTRIEAGTCKPTLSKVGYIAGRFGITLSELMPDYFELPPRYTELKYDILRNPTYDNPTLLEERNDRLNEIYDDYYDDLPEEERLAIDTLRSTQDIWETNSNLYGRDILDDYFHQVYLKKIYSVNDLLIIRLFFEHISHLSPSDNVQEFELFLELVQKLPEQVSLVKAEHLFVLRDTLFTAITMLGQKDRCDYMENIFTSLDTILERTQDFQKQPVLNMLRWKYELFVKKDKQQAEQQYTKAITFAELIGNAYLVEKLQKEWKEDCS